MKTNAILPTILATITRVPRHMPDTSFEGNLLTFNVFRLWELIFWRRCASQDPTDTIRAESATFAQIVDGKTIVVHKYFYTAESLLVFIECTIRAFFKAPKFAFKFVPVMQLAPAGFGQPALIPIFSFAIAHDADAVSTTQNANHPATWTHTSSGSNGLIAIHACVGSTTTATVATVSAATYNSVSATKALSQTVTFGSNIIENSTWLLKGPTSGLNTVSVTWPTPFSSPAAGGGSISYSGCSQTSTADATQNTTGTTTGDKTMTVTTVAANCWITMNGTNCAQSAPTMVADQTTRGNLTDSVWGPFGGVLNIADTNGSVSAGANTVGFTTGATLSENGYVIVAASIAPAFSATVIPIQLRPAIFKPGADAYRYLSGSQFK